MADTFLELKGFKELAAAMRELPERVAKNALRSAVGAGAAEIRKEAKLHAPVDTGRLKSAVYQKQIREASGQYKQVFFVGVRAGAKRKKGGAKDFSQSAYYWSFLEFGTAKMAARPFMRPAFEGKKEAAVGAIAKKLDERIQAFATELAKK
jgi:HK97 gp10 family phage protein